MARQSPESTTISAAWISPVSLGVQPVEGDVGLFAAGAIDVPTGDEELKRALETNRAKLQQALADSDDDPEERHVLIPQNSINAFYYALATQLYGPEQWRKKYQLDPRAKRKLISVQHEEEEEELPEFRRLGFAVDPAPGAPRDESHAARRSTW